MRQRLLFHITMLSYALPLGPAAYIGGSGPNGGTPRYAYAGVELTHDQVLALVREEEEACAARRPSPPANLHDMYGATAPACRTAATERQKLRAAIALLTKESQ